MSDFRLRDFLERLGLMQTELAKLLDVSPRTVSMWATGEGSLPGPVSAYLRLLMRMSAAERAEELRRLPGRSKMFDEGIYRLQYTGHHNGEPESETALAVLRNGKVLGSDHLGGVFSGSYEFDAIRETNKMHVRLQVPPEGMLVTGFSAGPTGATIDIVGSFERAAPVSKAVVQVAGEPIEIQLTYLGALPN